MAVSVGDIEQFVNSTIREANTGVTTEHSFRGFFKPLFESVGDIDAINEPQRSDYGAPDHNNPNPADFISEIKVKLNGAEIKQRYESE